MYLKQQTTGDLVEVLDATALVDPYRAEITGRLHTGEELQEPAPFAKAELAFPSGESLPRCWLDPEYRSASRSPR